VLYTFVGDVHGKWEAVEAALANDGQVIFVGDIVDSYGDRGVEDYRRCYDLILAAIEKGKARAIFGNHELSYYMPYTHAASGKTDASIDMMKEYEAKLMQKFEPFILLNSRFLVSHAGLSNEIWEAGYLDQADDLQARLTMWWHDLKSPMHWIGVVRGGKQFVGGMFWCDFRREFQPVSGLTQVFGHTRGRDIRFAEDPVKGGSYCIDCLDFTENKFLQLDV